jgi:acetyl esterase/lipase
MPSLQHRVAVVRLRLMRAKADFADRETAAKTIARMRAEAAEGPPPEIEERVRLERTEDSGFPVYTVRPLDRANGEPEVMYLRGGQVQPLQINDWNFVCSMVERTGVTIVVPEYPPSPGATWRDSRATLIELAKPPGRPPPLLLGVSFGGAQALVIAQALAREGVAAWSCVISPVLDLTLSHPDLRRYDRADPWLSVGGLRANGTDWADDLDPAHPLVSPGFGTFEGLGPMLMITAERDILHPNAIDAAQQARAQGVDVDLQVGAGLIHAYPLLPLPDAEPAREHIAAFIRRYTASVSGA